MDDKMVVKLTLCFHYAQRSRILQKLQVLCHPHSGNTIEHIGWLFFRSQFAHSLPNQYVVLCDRHSE